MVSLGRGERAVTQGIPLPDIVIGGAPRSGTTFLCELLAKHPQIHVARPFIPEPKICMVEHANGDAGILARYGELFNGADRSKKRVEKTSYYFENVEARARLVRVLPEARFIFILREPVARAYSNWVWSRKNGLETLPFEEAVRLEGSRSSPLPPERSYTRPFAYMERGRYGTFAEAWIGGVGRDRIAFYVLEEALDEPARFVEDLQLFIGVDVLPWDDLQTGKINAADADTPLSSALASRLREHIAPEVKHFAKLTGVDVGAWGYY